MTDTEESLALSETSILIMSEVKTLPEENGYDLHYNRDSDKAKDDRSDTDIEHNNNSINKKSEKISGLKIFTILSGRQKYTLICMAMANCLAGVAFSLLGPFYPTEAVKKGMTITTVGFVFGIYEMIIFLTAPVFGTFLVKIGPRFVFIAGISVAGCCNILFGTLEYCPSGTAFIVMSALVRSVEAVGFSAYITSSFAIVGSEYKENVALIFGILETTSGLGYMLGPTIGGALYELGGFGVPFYFAGVAVLLTGLAVFRFLPPVEVVRTERKGSILVLLRNPMIFIPLMSVMFGVAGITTFDSTFARHAEPLNLSVSVIGILFGFVALLYSLMCSLWGYISDSKDIQAPLIVGGHVIFGIGFFFLGPSNLFPFLSFKLVPLLVGLVLIGSTYGCTLIPTMKCMVTGATEMGFENSVDTYALVSGLFNSFHTLGGFIGPVGVGYLVEEFDYPVAYTVVGMCHVFMTVLTGVFFAYRKFTRGKKGTYRTLDSVDVGDPKTSSPQAADSVTSDHIIVRDRFTRSLSISVKSN